MVACFFHNHKCSVDFKCQCAKHLFSLNMLLLANTVFEPIFYMVCNISSYFEKDADLSITATSLVLLVVWTPHRVSYSNSKGADVVNGNG